MDTVPARVGRRGGFSLRYNGVQEFAIDAKDLRGAIKAMDRLYPGLGEHLEEETTVAIDGDEPATISTGHVPLTIELDL